MSARWRVAILTLLIAPLIWLYAEAESLTRATRDLRVEFVAPPGNLTIHEDPGWGNSVRVTLEGSTAALARAPREVELSVGDVGIPVEPGEHSVDLRLAVRTNREVARAGFNVVDVEPRTVRVVVRRLTTIGDVEIRPDFAGVDVASPPVCEPTRATLTAPEETVAALRAMPAGAHLVARVSPSSLAGAREGEQVRVRVAIALPPGLNPVDASFNPPETQVTLTLRARSATLSLPSVPVRILLPSADAARFQVDLDPEFEFLREITVVGPSESIDRLRARETSLVAVASLSKDDLENGATSKKVSFLLLREGEPVGLPSGLSVQAPTDSVRFTVRPAQAPPATPAPENGAPPG